MKRNVPSNAGAVVLEEHQEKHTNEHAHETSSATSQNKHQSVKKRHGVPICEVHHIPEHRKIQFVHGGKLRTKDHR